MACNVIANKKSGLRTLYLNGGTGTEDEDISGGRVEDASLSQVEEQHVAVGLCRMKSAKIRGVLFDFGGTLLYYNREEILRSLLEEQGITVRWNAVARAFETAESRWYAGQEGRAITDEDLERWNLMILESLGVHTNNKDLAHFIAKNWWRMEQQLPQQLVKHAYPDARPCLERLSKLGLKMGIVSNVESEQRLRKELEFIQLSQFFHVLVASGSVGYAKPARQIFDIASNLVRLSPEEIVFVGDDFQRDYQGALKAGMTPALIDRQAKYPELPNINRLSSLEQLPKLLE